MANIGIAIVIPGIMGSCLTYPGAHEDIWTEDFVANYKRLVPNASLLSFSGNRATPTAILKTARLGFIPYKHLYGRLLDALNAHPAFQAPGCVVEFPYDWRCDLSETARMLGDVLRDRFGEDVDAWPGPITPVTHSMGALVLHSAIGQGQLPTAAIEKVIQIGAPMI